MFNFFKHVTHYIIYYSTVHYTITIETITYYGRNINLPGSSGCCLKYIEAKPTSADLYPCTDSFQITANKVLKSG